MSSLFFPARKKKKGGPNSYVRCLPLVRGNCSALCSPLVLTHMSAVCGATSVPLWVWFVSWVAHKWDARVRLFAKFCLRSLSHMASYSRCFHHPLGMRFASHCCSFGRFQHRWWDKRFCHEGSELLFCPRPTFHVKVLPHLEYLCLTLRGVFLCPWPLWCMSSTPLVWGHRVSMLQKQTSSFLLFNKKVG